MPDHRVDHYLIQYGTASGRYDHRISTPQTSVLLSGLERGETYYFRARACDRRETQCSSLSNELVVSLPHEAPVADFTASLLSGVAPLTVTFSDRSSGAVSERAWDFGDGGVSTGATAVYTFTRPGTYRVSLEVTGPGGTDTLVKPALIQVAAAGVGTPSGAGTSETGSSGLAEDQSTEAASDPRASLPIEIGEVQIDRQWQYTAFSQHFSDPVLILGGLGSNSSAPALIRVAAVDGSGFWARSQQWDDASSARGSETASYLVIERGRYQLPDGAWIEADSLETNATGEFQYQPFAGEFGEAPVVLAALNSASGQEALTIRLKDIDAIGFQLGLWQKEAGFQAQGPERIDYVAWEASVGLIAGLRYEVGRVAEEIDDRATSLSYASVFARTPVLLAAMQTTNDADPAILGADRLGPLSADLWIQEERSQDSETRHAGETIGYFALDVEGS